MDMLLCPCCNKKVKPGIGNFKFKKHLEGCEKSFGKEKGKKHFKKNERH